MSNTPENSVLQIDELTISFKENNNIYNVVKDVTISAQKGKMTGLIGESGCGKTVTALSAIGLLPDDAIIESGHINFLGDNMDNLSENDWNKYRGKNISMIFQEPMTSLNPLMKVGVQIQENIKIEKITKKQAKTMTYDIMKKVGLSDVEKLYNSYPHSLSGGMRQRIMIAMALINNPELVIADEPTTALDATIQAQIMVLLKKLNQDSETAILLISHDLGLVKELCSKSYIMYAGRIVESGDTEKIIKNPLHPYTIGLIKSIPNVKKRGERLSTIKGFVPSIEERKSVGCPFAKRCEKCMKICNELMPQEKIIDDISVYCHLYDEKCGEFDE
ncbi:MAG: ABC transporter ATP-binding protein [Oscillospiraceae bacterium]